MVKLKVTARIIPEDVYLASLELAVQPSLLRGEKKYYIVVKEPEEWYIGTLANAIKNRYHSIYKADLGLIKYLKANDDDCDLDPEELVSDVLVNEGRALTDRSDQYATIKVIQEQGRAIRQGSVIPDLTPTHFRVPNKPERPPVPRFEDVDSALGKRKASEDLGGRSNSNKRRSRLSEIEGDDLVASIERDQPSSIVVQDSQPTQEDTRRKPVYQPRSTSPDLGWSFNRTGPPVAVPNSDLAQERVYHGTPSTAKTPIRPSEENRIGTSSTARSPFVNNSSTSRKFLRQPQDLYSFPESDIDDSQMSPRSRSASRITPRLLSDRVIRRPLSEQEKTSDVHTQGDVTVREDQSNQPRETTTYNGINKALGVSDEEADTSEYEDAQTSTSKGLGISRADLLVAPRSTATRTLFQLPNGTTPSTSASTADSDKENRMQGIERRAPIESSGASSTKFDDQGVSTVNHIQNQETRSPNSTQEHQNITTVPKTSSDQKGRSTHELDSTYLATKRSSDAGSVSSSSSSRPPPAQTSTFQNPKKKRRVRTRVSLDSSNGVSKALQSPVVKDIFTQGSTNSRLPKTNTASHKQLGDDTILDSPSEQLSQSLQESTRKPAISKNIRNKKSQTAVNEVENVGTPQHSQPDSDVLVKSKASAISPAVDTPIPRRPRQRERKSDTVVEGTDQMVSDETTALPASLEKANLPFGNTPRIAKSVSFNDDVPHTNKLVTPAKTQTIREASSESHVTTSSRTSILPPGMSQAQFDELVSANARLNLEPKQPTLRKSRSRDTDVSLMSTPTMKMASNQDRPDLPKLDSTNEHPSSSQSHPSKAAAGSTVEKASLTKAPSAKTSSVKSNVSKGTPKKPAAPDQTSAEASTKVKSSESKKTLPGADSSMTKKTVTSGPSSASKPLSLVPSSSNISAQSKADGKRAKTTSVKVAKTMPAPTSSPSAATASPSQSSSLTAKSKTKAAASPSPSSATKKTEGMLPPPPSSITSSNSKTEVKTTPRSAATPTPKASKPVATAIEPAVKPMVSVPISFQPSTQAQLRKKLQPTSSFLSEARNLKLSLKDLRSNVAESASNSAANSPAPILSSGRPGQIDSRTSSFLGVKKVGFAIDGDESDSSSSSSESESEEDASENESGSGNGNNEAGDVRSQGNGVGAVNGNGKRGNAVAVSGIPDPSIRDATDDETGSEDE